jgi:YydF family exported signaling peptide
MKDLEFKELIKKSEELEKVSDLWYFITNNRGAWIIGPGWA